MTAQLKRLYISDLDGTLLSPKPEITAHTAEIMNALARKGMNFTFATARSIYSAVPITSALDINVPCILMNGVSIYDIKNERYVKNEFIEPAVSAKLLDIYRRHGVECYPEAFKHRHSPFFPRPFPDRTEVYLTCSG